MRTALLTGVTGQDGSYLTEYLLDKGYRVHGIIRRTSTFTTERIDHLYHDPHESGVQLSLHYGDLTDATGLRRILERVQPDEVYNLGAQSHVKVSFEEPEYTVDVVGLGTLRLLEAIRDYRERTDHDVRFYQASSSEMFGACPPPRNRNRPRFTRAVRTHVQKSTATGKPSTTAKPMECSQAMASCSIMRAHVAAGRSSRERSPGPQRASNLGYNRSSIWAI